MKINKILIAILFIFLFSISTVYAEYTSIMATAKVIEAGDIQEQDVMGYNMKVQNVKLEILDGDFKGKTVESTYSISYDLENKIEGYPLDNGNKVKIEISALDGEITQVTVQDLVRQDYLIIMLILFAALILLVGRKQGLKAIAAFIVTIVGIFSIMLPAIINGMNPIFISIAVSIGIIVVSFLIIAGINKKSFTAMLGTTGGVVFAGIISAIFGIMAKLSGGQEEALYLSMNTQNLVFNYRELLFAGILIASLGACMDVGMSIASALDELKRKKPELTGKELFKSGMSIGGDVIGTMSNTLILAYVGGAISLVLLYMVNGIDLSTILNIEKIATDIISAVGASMGVVFTVPVTAFVYSIFNFDKKYVPEKTDISNRSLKLH